MKYKPSYDVRKCERCGSYFEPIDDKQILCDDCEFDQEVFDDEIKYNRAP